tara:strand:+ start:17924 stop:22804 length:4881 start_codon:yes stop_codon:yes gene_type:complete
MNYEDSPNYLSAADNHSIAAAGLSFFEDIGNAAANTPDFLFVSAMSAANSFYNTGNAVGNIFRDRDNEVSMRDTGEWITSMDDDLGSYYKDVKGAADLTGFVVSSFIPGGAAIKGLRAAQGALTAAKAGEVGYNMSVATRLLAPSMETYVKREAAMLAGRQQAFSFMHQNSLKALASGTHQAVLESVAFETAVAATMFQSPILEDMDVWDIMKTGLIGVGFGSALGAVGSAAGTYFGVKRLVQNANARANPFYAGAEATTVGAERTGNYASDQIVLDAMQLTRLEQTPATLDGIRNTKIAQGETGESLHPDAIFSELTRVQEITDNAKQVLQNRIRTGLQQMTKQTGMGNYAFELFSKMGPRETVETMLNMKEMRRAGVKTDFELEIKAYRDMIKKRDGKSITRAQALKRLNREDPQFYIQLHSGSIGQKTQGRAGTLRMADRFSEQQLANRFSGNFRFRETVDFRLKGDPTDFELRWALSRKPGSPVPAKLPPIHSHDLPALDMLRRAGVSEVTLTNGQKVNPAEWLPTAQMEVIQAQKANKANSATLEIIADVRKDFLEGNIDPKLVDDPKWFRAQESYAKELDEFLGGEGKVTAWDLHSRPSKAKVIYDTSLLKEGDGMVMKGMVMLKHRNKLSQMDTDRIVSRYLGTQFDLLAPRLDNPDDGLYSTEYGSTFLTNAGGEYGSRAQRAAYIGDAISEVTKTKITALTEEVQSKFSNILLAKPDEAIRFEGINSLVTRTPDHYVLHPEGKQALVPEQLADYWKAMARGDENITPPQLHPNTVEEIPLDSEDLYQAVKYWIDANDAQLLSRQEFSSLEGRAGTKRMGIFAPVRPDPRNVKHVAFVRDSTITGGGMTQMVYADSAAKLQDMMRQIRELGTYQIIQKPTQGLKIYTRGQAEDWHKAYGDWQYDKTLYENHINSDLLRKGIATEYLPLTDPDLIVNRAYQQLVRNENTNIRTAFNLTYKEELNAIAQRANEWNLAKDSTKGRLTPQELLLQDSKNPYTGMMKSMLNITKTEEYGLVNTMQQALDAGVSKVWDSAQRLFTDSFRGAGKITDERVDEINQIFEDLGVKSAYQDAATMMMVNSQVPRGTLTRFVRTANALLTTTILRLDAFNAFNNLVGNTILYSTEVQSLLKSIKTGDSAAAGELAKLARTKVPGTGGDDIFSPLKLMENSIKRLHGEGKDALIAEYRRRGLLPDLSDQYYRSLDTLTLTGTETVANMNSKTAQLKERMKEWANTGEKWTGNKWAEQFNRLIAIDTMKQITEYGVKAGVIDERTAWQYVSTFNKRVNGVIRAAERPGMFQGPVGQAIGLFQSYQMNLMAQVFRHVGAGRGKTLAMMGGLQTTIYGASSMPGFALINHQIGMAPENREHYDLYSAAYQVFGQEGADWLMYGAPSNVLDASLYTRGNTNPRVWHIVPNPTNPTDLPFLAAGIKAFGAIKGMATQAADGVPVWESVLSGLEHSGLSRPLAGFAAVARSAYNDGTVISTQRNGSIAGSNDLMSMATLARIAGAKPMDEAVVTNSYFRINAYAEADRQAREELGIDLKQQIRGGGEISNEAVANFAEQYVGRGGSQRGFNQWFMNQYENANKSQATQLAERLDSPYARRMQEVMGGRESNFDLSY